MAVALIVAAGRGERLGSGGPKALVTVAGRPMLEWSLVALAEVQIVSAVVVALPADRLSQAPEGVIAVAGGATRSESVRAALAAAPADDVVIVHDAARALVTPALFTESVAELERSGADAVVVAAPVTDTIKQAREPVSDAGSHLVERTLDRALLWSIQTPQTFRRAALERALEASPGLLAAATDDAWLIERQGGTVAVLPAPPENLKITTPLDLRVAELILAERSTA